MFKLFLSVIILLALVKFNRANDNLNEINNETIVLDSDDEYDYDQDDEQGHCSNEGFIEKLNDILLPEDMIEGIENVKYEQATLQTLLNAYERLGQYRQNVTGKLSSINKIVINRLKDNFLYLDISPQCVSTLRRILDGINSGQPWASTFISSQPDIRNSLFERRLPNNRYDECLSIESPEFEHGTYITGQYCQLDLASIIRDADNEELFSMLYPLLKNISYIDDSVDQGEIKHTIKNIKSELVLALINFPGFCLPKNCEPNEMSLLINTAFYQMTKVYIPFDNDCAYKGKPTRWNTIQLYSIAIILIITMAVFIVTILDQMKYCLSPTGLYMILINCFSAIKSCEKLLSVRNDNQFKCLAAIKVIFLFYLVWSHNYLFSSLTTYSIYSKNYRGSYSTRYSNIWFAHNLMLISGITVFLQNEKRFQTYQTNWIICIIKRYCKILPTLIGALLLSFLFENISQGPFWSIASAFITKNCMKTWYLPFTMLNNFQYFLAKSEVTTSITTQCLPLTWFIGANFQLYILAPIILIPLIRQKYFGWINIALIGAFTIPIPMFLTGLSNYHGTFIEIEHPLFLKEKFVTLYNVATWLFIPDYLIGICLAYIVKNKLVKELSWSSKLFVTTLSISLMIFYFIWKKIVLDVNYQITGTEKQIYLVVNKLIYLTGLAMLIFLCATNNLGLLNKILSSRLFQVMANLSLQVFVIQDLVIALRVGINRQITIYSPYILITNSVFDFILAYLLSFVTYILFISPAQNVLDIIISIIFTRKIDKTITKNKNENNDIF